jgi:hypothetical protein
MAKHSLLRHAAFGLRLPFYSAVYMYVCMSTPTLVPYINQPLSQLSLHFPPSNSFPLQHPFFTPRFIRSLRPQLLDSLVPPNFKAKDHSEPPFRIIRRISILFTTIYIQLMDYRVPSDGDIPSQHTSPCPQNSVGQAILSAARFPYELYP